MFDVCTTGDTAHIDSIFKFLPKHASTRVHRYSSLLHVPSGQRGHVAMVGRILCTKCTLHSNHSLTRVMFQQTKLLLRSGHFLTTYPRIAQRQKCELRCKTTYWGKKFELFLLSVQVSLVLVIRFSYNKFL